MEIKRMAIALAIDNEKNTLSWQVRADFGLGFQEITKNPNELKAMLKKVIEGIVEAKEIII